MNDNVRENLIMVLYEQAEVEIKNNDHSKALSTLKELMEFIQDRPEHIVHGGAKRLYAMIHKYQGKYYPALNAASEALAFFEERNDYPELYNLYMLKGDIHFHFCKYDKAITEWQQAVEMATLVSDEAERSHAVANVHLKLGEAYMLLSQYRDARSHFVKSLSYARLVADPNMTRYCQAGLGSTFHLENRFELALRIYYRTLKLALREHDQVLLGRLLHSIADIFSKKGEFARARKIYQESLKLSEENQDFLTSAATLREIGRLHLKDSPEQTVTFCEKSLDKLIENITVETRGECERLMGKAFYLMALYHWSQKESKLAMNNLVEAGEIFQRYNMTKDRKRAEILYQEMVGKPVAIAQPQTVKSKTLSMKLGVVN